MSSDELATYRHCLDRLTSEWPTFLDRRQQRLAEQRRWGVAAEKVAENIVEDLFTRVLDWPLADVNHQVDYADLVLTRLGIKHLLVETKRPGALAWNRRAVEAALEQARRYADEQKVHAIAVSDGIMLYAADIEHGGLRDRAFVSLQRESAPESLWWLSVDGIYRPCDDDTGIHLLPEPVAQREDPAPAGVASELLHPKYHVPARCFAYVGDAGDPGTWKLPYLRTDGRTDGRRLPKAVQAVLSNYRGAHVHGIPEDAIPDVLARLGHCAAREGKLPFQCGNAAAAYERLEMALEQIGRLDEVKAATGRLH